MEETIRLPRYEDMELELLGMCILKEGVCVPKVTAILTAEDFYVTEYQYIFSAITDLYSKGTPPNMPTIADWLHRKGYIYSDGKDKPSMYDKVSTQTIMALGQVAFTTAYAEVYAKKIKETSDRRKLIQLGDKIKKDALDMKTEFTQLVINAENAFRDIAGDKSQLKITKTQNYFDKFFENDIAITKLYSERKTGFYNLDKEQIFMPGLYVIGATPAAGKTTFCWQLLDQLSKNGETCIFCSYEMSAFELYSKSLARELYLSDPKTKLSAADIRRGGHSRTYDKVLAKLLSNENGINLLELRDETIDDLFRALRPYCTVKGKSPVVCLDYLQIIPPSKDTVSDKARIDDIVHKLKTFQRETNTTFIVVSSFNRTNYFQQVSFESFKESGNIEYTADVVWAMQLNVANDIKNGALISETRKKFEDAKREQPRQVQLKCLKNRQGQNYDCFFKYYSAHDYFKACEEADFKTESSR